MPGTKRRAPYKYSEQQTVRSSHRPLTPWLALAGKPVNRCPRTTCAYSDCRAFAGIPSRLFLLSESQQGLCHASSCLVRNVPILTSVEMAPVGDSKGSHSLL